MIIGRFPSYSKGVNGICVHSESATKETKPQTNLLRISAPISYAWTDYKIEAFHLNLKQKKRTLLVIEESSESLQNLQKWYKNYSKAYQRGPF